MDKSNTGLLFMYCLIPDTKMTGVKTIDTRSGKLALFFPHAPRRCMSLRKLIDEDAQLNKKLELLARSLFGHAFNTA